MSQQPVKLLTLRRMEDGTVMPHVDGLPLLGCTQVVVSSSEHAIQMQFRTEFVLFDTAPNAFAEKMN